MVGLVHSLPALESFLFWVLTALVRILFLADLAFINLNLSKSLRDDLFLVASILLAQLDAAHFPEMSSDFQALLTTRDRAENGNFAWRGNIDKYSVPQNTYRVTIQFGANPLYNCLLHYGQTSC